MYIQELETQELQLKRSNENQDKQVQDFRLISENYLTRLEGVRKQITQFADAKKTMKKKQKESDKLVKTLSEDLEKKLNYAVNLETQLKTTAQNLQQSRLER